MGATPEAGALDDVLAVERELAEQIGAGRQNAARWLEERKREIDEAARHELERLEQTARDDEQAARKAAGENAAALVEDSKSVAGVEAVQDTAGRRAVAVAS